MNAQTDMSVQKVNFRYLSGFIVLAFVLFISAGKLSWTEAWLLLLIYMVREIMIVNYLKKRNPDLLIERLAPFKSSIKAWDKKLVRLHTIFLMLMICVTGMDAVRYKWTNIPLNIKAIAFVGIILSSVLIYWVYRENLYLSKIVEILTHRGHKVIRTGPYRYIRHPLYLANICTDICVPLALGSLYALIPSLFLIIIIVVRTHFEDKTLQVELPGYQEYTQRVQYKLIPLVW